MIAFSTRVSYAFHCFFAILSQGEIPRDIACELITSPDASSTKTPERAGNATAIQKVSQDSVDRAVQILALFQRDGRLVDFLAEDISSYPDGQLGAASRTIHNSCRQVLERYVKLEPIISAEEDQPVTVPPGIDPAAIKLVGNVGEPPLRGMLRHRGWQVKEVNLPALPQGTGRKIVAPAEVEVA